MKQTEALKLALEALEKVSTRAVIMGSTGDYREGQLDALSSVSQDVASSITAIKEALAQQEQEPDDLTIAYMAGLSRGKDLAPQRKPLTDEEKDSARWRFLVSNSFDKEGLAQFHVWHHTWEPHSQTSEPTEWKARVRGPALKRVIDEAIEDAHGIKGEE